MTEPQLTSARPVFEVDGEVRGELGLAVTRLEVEERTDGLKTFSARFLAWGQRTGSTQEELLYLGGRIFDFGKPIAVSVGPAQDARTVFRGKVSALEASFEETTEPEVIVFAEDELMDMRMTRRTRTYENMSDADIAEELASLHGLGAEADADGPTYDRVQQWNLSDLAFLRERARLVQAEVWVRDGTLRFQSRSRRSAPDVTLVAEGDILSLSLRADLAHQRTSVRVTGYDARAREAIDEEAGREAIQAEVSGGRTGVDILQASFGERVSLRSREVPLTTGEAREWARAEMLRRSRGFVQAVGTTRGTPDLTVGSRLTLDRVGSPFQGNGYYVTRVRQTFDSTDGYRTYFEAERATVEGGR